MSQGGTFTREELEAIDRVHRAGGVLRCPEDDKPLVTTAWRNPKRRMVYFVCRACGRIGAVAYESDDPSVPGTVAGRSRPTSRPPPSR
ncbi:MAG: hypothetical protein NVS3B10_20400 [Polyangiales bacterium]